MLRTKVDTHALMVAAEEKDILLALDCNGVFIFSEVHPAPDGMFALSKLLELIAMQNTSLQQVIAGLPKFYWMRATLPCPWDAKGRVMREVNEGVSPYIIDTIDGVRFSASDARWALIRPDADRPLLHVVAQGHSESDTADLLQQQVAWVRQIVAVD